MWGNIIPAVGSIVGGLLNSNATSDANAANLMFQRNNMKRQARLQKLFANRGIQWKVRDARKAGIHPLYALGASTTSYAPQSVGNVATPDTAMGDALSSASQHIGRAINATSTHDQAFTGKMQALQLERGTLENELLRSQLVRASAPGTPGPLPSENQKWLVPGQASAAIPHLITNEPLKRTASDPLAPYQEPGAITDTGHLRTSGGLFPVPSDNAKQRIEDNWYQETMHFIRNNALPMISPAFNQPPHAAKPGMAWVYSPIYGYKQVPDKWYRKFLRH